jgi:hypothetical protein
MHVVILKLDFRKAFDSANWEALNLVLRAHGFGSTICRWIAAILSTRKIAALLNGVPRR